MKTVLVRITPETFEAESRIPSSGLVECPVFFAGFVSNRDELMDLLGMTRSGPAAISDADILAMAYRRWKATLSRHVLGQYAGVAIDMRERSIVLFQDSMGLAPLFYAQVGRSILVASKLEDLVDLSGGGDLDEDYVADFIATSMPSPQRTPYVGVKRLRFGSTVVWRSGQWSETWPWRPSDAKPARLARPEEYDEALRELLSQAVDTAAPSTGRTWCELSGGLDSSTVVAFAAHHRSNIETFTFLYDSMSDDERAGVAAVLEKTSLGNFTLRVEDAAPFSIVPTRLRGEPGTEIVAAQQQAYDDSLAQHDVSTVLTGMGGDSAFGSEDWTPHFLGDYVVQGQARALWREVHSWRRTHPSSRSTSFWIWKYALRSAVRHRRGMTLSAAVARRLPSWLNPDYATRMALSRRSDRQLTPRCDLPGRQALWQDAFLDAFVLAPAHGGRRAAEFRHPLFHRPLLEFLFTVNYQERRRPDADRLMQRRALNGILPDKVRLRTTKDSSQRIYTESLGRSGEWFELLTNSPEVVARGYVDARRWGVEVQRARFGATESIRHFYSVASLEAWLRGFKTARSHRSPPRASRDTMKPFESWGD